MNMKKLFLLNLPYLLFVYPFDKLAQAFRLAPGADLSGKLLSIGDGFTAALSSPWLSFHPTDLLIGIAGAVILRMAVYLKGKNAKKYRHGIEYGSARWRAWPKGHACHSWRSWPPRVCRPVLLRLSVCRTGSRCVTSYSWAASIFIDVCMPVSFFRCSLRTDGPEWSALEVSYIEMELHGIIKIRITASLQCIADTPMFFNGKFHVAVGGLYFIISVTGPEKLDNGL